MIIDYDYYIRHYPKSSVTISEFTVLNKRAQREIENAVTGTIDTTDDNVKMCACELINYLAKTDETATEKSGIIASESVGDYSVSYRSETERRNAAKAEKVDIIRFWLGKSGIAYRGVSRRVY